MAGDDIFEIVPHLKAISSASSSKGQAIPIEDEKGAVRGSGWLGSVCQVFLREAIFETHIYIYNYIYIYRYRFRYIHLYNYIYIDLDI